jgi:hypothetical protein
MREVLPARICPQAGDRLVGGGLSAGRTVVGGLGKSRKNVDDMVYMFSKPDGIPLPQIPDLAVKLPWNVLFEQGGKLLNFIAGQIQKRGLYEVLEYESTLELLDSSGKLARYSKRQQVRYLQNNIIAYQDQAWGDGEILVNYRCSPGVPVDRYKLGHKTLILISLREIKQLGDMDEFNIQWEMKNGFRQAQESWETEISHTTRKAKIQVIFPQDRPPTRAIFIEASRQLGKIALNENRRQLPDGRWQVTWEIHRPRLSERYILKWSW